MRNFITFPGVVVVLFLIFASAADLYLSAPDDVCEIDIMSTRELVDKRNKREDDFSRPAIYKNQQEGIIISLGYNRYTTWDNVVSFGKWDVGGGVEDGKTCYWPTRMYFIEQVPQRSRETIIADIFSMEHTTILGKSLKRREALEYPGEPIVATHLVDADMGEYYTLEYIGGRYNYIFSAHHGRDSKENIDLWRHIIAGSTLP